MKIYPEPDAEDVPFNEPYTVDLQDGQEATIKYSPAQSGSTFYVAALGISKHRDSTYEVVSDGTVMYGPASIPPTDIDDLAATWIPCRRFETELTVRITNLSGNLQEYHVQPIGFERIQGEA